MHGNMRRNAYGLRDEPFAEELSDSAARPAGGLRFAPSGTRPLRILQFGRFWNDQHGGVERHVSQLSEALAERGADVVNLVASSGLRGSDERYRNFRLVQSPSFGKAFSTAMSPWLVTRAMALHKENPFDVFHLHLPDPLTHAASLALPRDIPRVITWHSDIVKQRTLNTLYKPLMQREVLRVQAIVAATSAHFKTSTQIPAAFPLAGRHVIPFGMDYSGLAPTPHTALLSHNLRAAVQKKAGVTRENLKVIFALGRHVSYKGFDVLIDAMRYNNAQLIIGGDGPLRAALESQASQLGLTDRVTFTGRIPEEDLAAYFYAGDVFCLPSVTAVEAFGLVQLEAMACGKPVVCTRLGNGVNVVNTEGVTGRAVPVGDAAALGQCLGELLADPAEMWRLGSNGRRAAHERYGIDAMAQSHLNLYRSLLLV